jgi:hypothetical protein
VTSETEMLDRLSLPAIQRYDRGMNEADEKRIAAKLAKTLAILCVRNTALEDLHAGITPVSKTGDYSDVVVTNAEGREIPWTEVSHLDDEAMRALMRQIVNRLYTFHLIADDPDLRETIDRWAAATGAWDDPEIDQGLLGAVTVEKKAGDS